MKSYVLVLITLSVVSSILIRQKAPLFSSSALLENQAIGNINLADYKGKYVVLLFYPFDFTFVCPTELHAFSDATDQFDAINAKVIGISADSVHTHLAWTKISKDKGGIEGIKIPLIADFSKTISKTYQVLVENPEDELYGAPLRGLYIIDEEGDIMSASVNDAPVGRSVDEVIRLIKAFQFVKSHGEVCPANWQPGSNTIIPDHEKKAQYFNKQ